MSINELDLELQTLKAELDQLNINRDAFLTLRSQIKQLYDWIKNGNEPETLIEERDEEGVLISSNQSYHDLWLIKEDMFDLYLTTLGISKDEFIMLAISDQHNRFIQVEQLSNIFIRNINSNIATKESEIRDKKSLLIDAFYDYHNINI